MPIDDHAKAFFILFWDKFIPIPETKIPIKLKRTHISNSKSNRNRNNIKPGIFCIVLTILIDSQSNRDINDGTHQKKGLTPNFMASPIKLIKYHPLNILPQANIILPNTCTKK